MKEVNAFPLSWPVGWKRTERHLRRDANFFEERKHSSSNAPARVVKSRERVGVRLGVDRILAELGRFGIQSGDVIVSSNVRVRLDGLPRAGEREPDDPGVAVYWTEWNNAKRVMAIDRYDRVADNLVAVARTIEAMRTIERHGGAVILDRAFSGFAALPSPISASKPWRDVLGFTESGSATTKDNVEYAYRKKRGEVHPDRTGGDSKAFLAVEEAYEQAARELGFST